MKHLLKYNNFIKESIENSNFKNWFKNSKVVDKQGNPLIVYHGSKSDDFEEFSKSNDIGYHFAQDIKIAKKMCGSYEDDWGNTTFIKPKAFYLSIQKLGYLPDLEFWTKRDLLKSVEEYKDILAKRNIHFEYDMKETFIDNLKRFSFLFSGDIDGNYKDIDGFVYSNDYERVIGGIHTCFIALNPNQIKSVDNKGNWNSNDNNFYN